MTEFGRYVVIEGSDGTGKSTVAENLAHLFRGEDRRVIRVDEPASAVGENGERLAPIADEIRSVILNKELSRRALTSFYLFHAQRVENWHSAIKPALESGVDVISARSYLSSIVYQGYTEGVDPEWIREITERDLGKEYTNPDYETILYVEDEAVRKQRMAGRGEATKQDYFESKSDDFQLKLSANYMHLANELGIETINSQRNTPEVMAKIIFSRIFDKDITSHPFED